MLTVGPINNLFDENKKSEIRNQIRDQAKRENYGESPEQIWECFENLVRKNLHLVLCMSPAGSQLRVRCRNFPGLVSSANIDWFFSWPQEALQEVAQYQLQDF